MTKQNGLGDNLYVGGYDLSGDVGAVDRVAGPMSPLDVTGINKSAYERLGGRRDGVIDFTTYFNPTAGQAHPVLSPLPTADVHVAYCRGTTLGNQAACMVAKQVNYDPTRGADGSLTFKVNALANGYGVEWGRQLTAGKRSDTAATNGTGVDFTAQTAFGLQMYLQVFSFTGTLAAINIQTSSDNGATDAYANLADGDFGVSSAPYVERAVTARDATIERYLRVATSGVFTEMTFAMIVVKNATTVTF